MPVDANKLIWQFEADARRRETERKLAQKKNPLDQLQAALDVAGLTPGVGVVPDLINAAISGGRGNKLEAGMSLGAAIPGLGWLFGAGKTAKKVKILNF